MFRERPGVSPVAPPQRLDNEIRKRTDPVASVPNVATEARPVDALAPERHDEW